MTVTTTRAEGRTRTQARGRARRQEFLETTRALLLERPLDQLSLTMVAEQAGIPASSIYHFYGDISELLKDVARAISLEMVAELDAKAGQGVHDGWQSIVRDFMRGASAIFNANRAARQLMLGPRTPPDIKRAACYEESRFGNALAREIEAVFVLPLIEDREGVFFRAVQICDLMFSLSVADHDAVTPKGCEEGAHASIAYLGLYLPPILPRRPARALKSIAREG